jgi:hypothetical protein
LAREEKDLSLPVREEFLMYRTVGGGVAADSLESPGAGRLWSA